MPSSRFPDGTYANCAWSVDLRGRPEERVDGGAEAVLARPLGDPEDAGFHQQMPVGRSDIDAARLQALAIPGIVRRQRPGTVQDGIENSRRFRRGVQDDTDRRGKILGQSTDEFAKGLDTAGGCADNNDALHSLPSAPGYGSVRRR